MLRGFAAEAIDALSPIRLFAREQSGKLAAEAGRAIPLMPGMAAGWEMGTKNKKIPQMLSEWWNGYHLDNVISPTHATGQSAMIPLKAVKSKTYMDNYYRQVAKNKQWRRGVAYGLGATAVAGLAFGNNSAPATTGRTAMEVGGYGAALFGVNEYGLRHGSPNMGRYAAGGLIGLSAFNLMRPGNNAGPF